MNEFRKIRETAVYQATRSLILNIYSLTRRPPWKHEYSLTDQIRRSSISILSNVAEGYERDGTSELIQYLSIAKGSTAEVLVQLDVALDIGLVDKNEHENLNQELEAIAKQLGGWMRYLQKSGHKGIKFKRFSSQKSGIRDKKWPDQGFAIISVLLVLTILTVMAVAFLHSMRVEHMSSRSYLNKTRADLIAQAAAQKALSQILQNTRNPVTSLTDLTYTVESAHPHSTATPRPDFLSYAPITVISRYETDGSGILLRRASPLISTVMAESDFKTGVSADFNTGLATLFSERTATTKTTDLNIRGAIQSLSTSIHSNAYRVPLLDITDTEHQLEGRYGFIVLDEQARLNPYLHRSAVRHPCAGSAEEMPVSLGNNVLLNPMELITFLAGPVLPSSPYAIGQIFSTMERAEQHRHLFGFYMVPNQDVIPAGYTDAGKPKYNLNTLATNTNYGATATLRAEHIASLINRNLPAFKTRDPSLAAESYSNQERYLNRLCAGMVDYIDTDTEITSVNGGEPAGRDLFPLVTTLAEHYACGPETGSGPYSTTIQSRVYLQIWNPYTVPVTGSARILVKNRMRVRYGTGIVTPFSDYNTAPISNITVRPNEFAVVAFPFVAETFNSPTGPNTSSGERPHWLGSTSETADQSTWVPFEFEWNGQRVDMNRRSPVSPGAAHAGMTRNAKTLAYNSLHYQVSSLPTFSHRRSVGDPRFTYLSNYDWGSTISGDASYSSNTCWKGRNRDTDPYTQDFVSTWALRDYMRANPVMGAAPGGINTAPDSTPSPYVQATEAWNAPFYIRNNAMLSIGELGHLFDPIQADDSGAAPSGGSPASLFVAGGGRSLRIGQPEFSYLDTNGKRAMQLLDLFTVNPPPSANAYPEFTGRININTASVEVLQALFYDIEIKSDEGFHQNDPAKISRVTEAKARLLADAIIQDRRDKGPYTRLSDLHRLFSMTVASGTTAAWSRADAYSPRLGANTDGDTAAEVMDRAREELFSKTVHLIDTQSRAFRIYSTGQVLGSLGNVIARSYLETIVTLQASTDASGVTTLSPQIIHERYY